MSCRTMDEAAKAIGVSTSTLRRWMDLPDFREAYLKARRQAVTQSYARLQQNSGAACTVLLKMMADPAVKPWARIQALGLPISRFSRMTSSKNTRPVTGRSSTWVSENSAWRMEIW